MNSKHEQMFNFRNCLLFSRKIKLNCEWNLHIPTRMTIIQKADIPKWWQEYGALGSLNIADESINCDNHIKNLFDIVYYEVKKMHTIYWILPLLSIFSEILLQNPKVFTYILIYIKEVNYKAKHRVCFSLCKDKKQTIACSSRL